MSITPVLCHTCHCSVGDDDVDDCLYVDCTTLRRTLALMAIGPKTMHNHNRQYNIDAKRRASLTECSMAVCEVYRQREIKCPASTNMMVAPAKIKQKIVSMLCDFW